MNSFSEAQSAAPVSKIRFNEHIRPILSNACFQCHGPDDKKREADLRLDTFEGATRDLGGYKAILPGNPEKSAIVERILSHDRDEVMPPPKSKKPPITAGEIELLKRWIAQGAPYEGHWAFQPLQNPEPPAVGNTAAVRNPVDRFVLAPLESRGIAPSPEADKATLLRRVHLDLTGLPPTPQESEAFLADRSPDAYERVVDALLASPHHGERWGRHWLDQARYADSQGYSVDGQRAMWPYRDWVIRALNADMPFNQFTVEQIAGDLLPNPTKMQRIASAFHRNTMINQEGGTDAEQFRNEAVVDRVNTTGAVWLGLTAGCAQCHSHKYDPLSHQEYFRLFAFFNSGTDVNSTGETVDVLPGELFPAKEAKVPVAQYEAARQRVAKAKQGVAQRRAEWVRGLVAATEPTQWHRPAIGTASSRSGRVPQIQDDGSVLVPKEGTPQDVIEVAFTPDVPRLEAIRLQVLPDPSFNAKFAGTGKDGSFALNELEVLIDGNAKAFDLAVSDLENAKTPLSHALDRDPATAWRLDPAAPASKGTHEAWLVLKEPVAMEGQRVVLRLRHETGAFLFIGKFAVSVAEKAPLLPPDPVLAAAAWKAAKDPQTAAQTNDPAFVRAFAKMDRVQAAADFEFACLTKDASPAQVMVMKDLPAPRPTFLHIRGDFLSPDKELGPLKPGTPEVLPALAVEGREATRLDLARWLVDPKNPLTPRVTVNRIWMRYFGQGLVETENDFGTQGTPPTHPELLDWLSRQFIDGGWSMKKLHRIIVTSATYRQSSVVRPELMETDPRNLLLARQNRFRVDAEIVRDSALAASGLLDPTLGGPTVYPPQPEGVYAFTQAAKPWVVSKGGERYRRALYTQFYRSAQHPLTSTFDAPNFSTTCTRRLRSNTPLQALMMANDETFMEMAQAAALRLWTQIPGASPQQDQERVEFAFRAFFNRLPSEKELKRSLEFLAARRVSYAAASEDAKKVVGAYPISGQSTGEAAAWTSFTRALLNTDEFITRE